jgi:hypothetical protein
MQPFFFCAYLAVRTLYLPVSSDAQCEDMKMAGFCRAYRTLDARGHPVGGASKWELSPSIQAWIDVGLEGSEARCFRLQSTGLTRAIGMRTRKAMGVVSLVLVMLAGATQAIAGPVLALASDGTFGNAEVNGSKKGFTDKVKVLHLDNSQWVTAYLSTTDQKLDIKDVHLVKLNAAGEADDATRIGLNEILAVDWSKQEGAGSERWEITPALLSAGDWQLVVTGLRRSKGSAAYTGAIQTDNKIPEPQTLALSILALAAMAGLNRCRKNT